MKPSSRTHLIAGAMVSMMVSYKIAIPVEGILFGILGSLFPDTDSRASKLGSIIPMWLVFRPHRRNLLHSLLGAVLVSLPFVILSIHYALLFFIGYLSHLLLDCFNKTGVPLFYPYERMFSFGRIKSKGEGEWILLFAFYMIIIAIMSL